MGDYRTVGRVATTSGKTLPKIKLKVQPNFDDPESEEETGNRPIYTSVPSAQPVPSSSAKQQQKLGGKTVPKAKQEVLSIRDPPCWRCKTLNKPCEASSLRFSCNTCYKRHWACSTNPPPPRQKKGSHSHSVSAPAKTKSLGNSTAGVGESISAASTNRGRSPLRSASKPAKRPRSPTPPSATSAPAATTSSHPQNKKTRTSLRTIIKPQQVNGSASTAERSAPSSVRPISSNVPQVPRSTEYKDLKAQVDILVQHDGRAQQLLEQHSLMLDAVLENMKVLLGDKFVEVKGKPTPSAPSVSGPVTSFDVDIDELDELTPIERSPEPSRAFTPVNGATHTAAPSMNTNTNGHFAGHSHPAEQPRIISVAPARTSEDPRKMSPSNGRKLGAASSFNGMTAITTTTVPTSSARDNIPPYRAILSASRTTTDNDDDGIEEEVDDDARSIPGISALPAAVSPTSTTSVDDPEGGYIADASHGPTPAPVATGSNKAPSPLSTRRESPSFAMSHARDQGDIQVESAI
ncbi:hypothetical protein GYMLUDRAFT_44249 [Collybiopsis luxurians FD-317 M1]|uniref:Zn(2)-C6 fungal-type domain-containing protein n=1 Tax=Collybiopsis luxurians FD-317 M1 TaxID=944289 RepID=A0A0D0BW42_9AGAR|nr:hypothetical protein GYMLUDRAFT_44249 [Collybiopsis luxurians FD-317 M1]